MLFLNWHNWFESLPVLIIFNGVKLRWHQYRHAQPRYPDPECPLQDLPPRVRHSQYIKYILQLQASIRLHAWTMSQKLPIEKDQSFPGHRGKLLASIDLLKVFIELSRWAHNYAEMLRSIENTEKYEEKELPVRHLYLCFGYLDHHCGYMLQSGESKWKPNRYIPYPTESSAYFLHHLLLSSNSANNLEDYIKISNWQCGQNTSVIFLSSNSYWDRYCRWVILKYRIIKNNKLLLDGW